MRSPTIDRLPLTAFVLAVLITGFNPIAIRYIVLDLPPFWGAAVRFLPASLIMLTIAWIMKVPIPKGRELRGIMLYGVLQFGASFALIYWGEEKVQPGMVSVILALGPLFTLLFAILHRLETFRWLSLFGAIFAVLGVGLVFREQMNAHVPLLSLLAVVFGALCFNEASVLIKKFPSRNPITTSGIAMGTGGTIHLIMSWLWREQPALPVKASTWSALFFLILLGSCVTFLLVLYVLKHYSASTVSYQFVLLPFVTLTASALITHEMLSPILLLGAAFVLTGVFIGGIYTSKKGLLFNPIQSRWINWITC